MTAFSRSWEFRNDHPGNLKGLLTGKWGGRSLMLCQRARERETQNTAVICGIEKMSVLWDQQDCYIWCFCYCLEFNFLILVSVLWQGYLVSQLSLEPASLRFSLLSAASVALVRCCCIATVLVMATSTPAPVSTQLHLLSPFLLKVYTEFQRAEKFGIANLQSPL